MLEHGVSHGVFCQRKKKAWIGRRQTDAGRSEWGRNVRGEEELYR